MFNLCTGEVATGGRETAYGVNELEMRLLRNQINERVCFEID